MTTRYALYFAPPPDDPLWRFGSAIIGYDAATGAELPFPDQTGSWGDWRARTEEPRRYGFHATLKAPFALLREFTEADILTTVDRFAHAEKRFAGPEPVVAVLGNFVALVPARVDERIGGLAARAVTTFEPFRAQLSAEARQRRLAAKLTERQVQNLDRYGYPYVFEDFRFHMTLTGPLAEAERPVLLDRLRALHEPVRAPLLFESICVFRQDGPASRFRIIHRARFEG